MIIHSRRLLRPAFALTLASMTWACVPDGNGARAAARVAVRADSAGVELVQLPAGDSTLGWSFDQQFVAGGAADTLLAASALDADRVALDDSARTYVLDGPAGVVRVIE